MLCNAPTSFLVTRRAGQGCSTQCTNGQTPKLTLKESTVALLPCLHPPYCEVWCSYGIAVCYSCVTKGQQAAGMLAFKATMLSLASLYRSSTRRTDVCAMTEGEKKETTKKPNVIAHLLDTTALRLSAHLSSLPFTGTKAVPKMIG